MCECYGSVIGYAEFVNLEGEKAILFALANSDVVHIVLVAKSKGQSCNNSFWTPWKNVTVVPNLVFVEVFLFFLDSLFFVLYNLPKAQQRGKPILLCTVHT